MAGKVARIRIRRTAAALALAVMVTVYPGTAHADVQPAKHRPPAPPITIAAVGDMSFDGAAGSLISRSGPTAPFSSVYKTLRRADVTVGNLECALSTRGRPVSGKAFTFRGSPKAVQGLTRAGFDLVAQGNNHALDWGPTALADTIKVLDRARIAHAGAGPNRNRAVEPTIIKRRGATIAFLSFSQIGPSSFAAGTNRAGTAYTLDRAGVVRSIKAAHKRAQYLIVSFHWGVEKATTPTSSQVWFGHAAIRAGAHVVLSHHPHVIQGVEYYRGRLIAYSLGNFVFSPGSTAGRDSMILHVRIDPKGATGAYAEPVHIIGGRPVLQSGSEARRILRIAARTSAAVGTKTRIRGSSITFLP